MLVDCVNNAGIIAGEADRGPLPFVMPEKEGVKDSKEFFPLNRL
jgi:hypothetical protein